MSLKSSAYKIEAKSFSKTIEIPSSKSYANRALIIGALKGNGFIVKNLSYSTDVSNLIDCLRQVGLKITQSNSEVTFHNKFPECEIKSNTPIALKTGDGGTTNRFLIGLLSLGQNEYRLIPSEKMNERPIEDLINPLKQLDVTVELSHSNEYWLSIKGPFKKKTNTLEVDCSKSTQFATALKLIESVLNIEIIPVNLNSSKLYWEMTKKLIEDTKLSKEYIVPADFSSLSYPVALAAIDKHNSVKIKNCFERDYLQADSKLFDILKSLDIQFNFSNDGLEVQGKTIDRGFDVDVSECPDLTMTLCFLASRINANSKIKNLKVLIHKESNRLQGIIDLLIQFNIQFLYHPENDELTIIGSQSKTDSKSVNTERDHRMVMMGYLLLRVNNGGELFNTDCIEKSFPDFLTIMN